MRGFVPTREHDRPTRGLLLRHGAAHPTPHPLAGSARPPPPTLTKVTVPAQRRVPGYTARFCRIPAAPLPGPGPRQAGPHGLKTGPSSARPSAASPRRPADSPGHRNTGGGSVLPLFRPDPAGVLNARRIRSYALAVARTVRPNCHPGHFAPGERFLTSGASERWMALSPRARGSLSPLSVPVAARFLRHCRHARAGGLPRSVSGALDPRSRVVGVVQSGGEPVLRCAGQSAV